MYIIRFLFFFFSLSNPGLIFARNCPRRSTARPRFAPWRLFRSDRFLSRKPNRFNERECDGPFQKNWLFKVTNRRAGFVRKRFSFTLVRIRNALLIKRKRVSFLLN